MPALKTLGLVILAALTIAIFAIGYRYSRTLASMRDAKEAALEVDAKVQAAIATGYSQTAEVTVPEGYTLRFQNNKIFIDNMAFPENGYPKQIYGPELRAGTHVLTITFENDIILVTS